MATALVARNVLLRSRAPVARAGRLVSSVRCMATSADAPVRASGCRTRYIALTGPLCSSGRRVCTIFTFQMARKWYPLQGTPCRSPTATSAQVRFRFLSNCQFLVFNASRIEQWLVTIISASPSVCLMSGTWCNRSTYPVASPRRPSLTFPCSFRGPTATAFLEWLTPSSLRSLAPYSSTLSVLLNECGGIIDDTIITKHADDAFYVVTNAGRRDRDLAWFKEKLEEWNAGQKAKSEGKVEHEVLEDWGLLALQGTSRR